MNLEEYLKKHSLTHKEFAETIGVSQSYITRIVNGKKNPSVALMRHIIELTNGEVTVGDLFNPSLPSTFQPNKKKKTENT